LEFCHRSDVLLVCCCCCLVVLCWLLPTLYIFVYRPELVRHHPLREPFLKLEQTSFWGILKTPQERLSRSYLLLVIYWISAAIRATSIMQVIKVFAKQSKEPGRVSVVPAWWVECYMFCWIVFGIAILDFTLALSIPATSLLGKVFAGLVFFRIVHIWHGTVYYNLLRAIYEIHPVHTKGRDFVLIIFSFAELILWHSILIVNNHSGFHGLTSNSLPSIVYYCVTTMLTIGYGDIYPISENLFAQVISVSIMLTGVSLFALCLGRMASLLPSPREHNEVAVKREQSSEKDH